VDFTNTIMTSAPRVSAGSVVAAGLTVITSDDPACSMARPSRRMASTCSLNTS